MSTVLPDELFQVIAQQAGLSRPLSPSTLFRFRFQLSSSAQAGSRQTGRETASAIASLAERYRVTGASDDLGDALDDALSRLVKASQVDDGELRIERLPDALHLLTLLAAPPTKATLRYADDLIYRRNQPEVPAEETWAHLVTGAEGAEEWASSSAPRYALSSSEDEAEDNFSSSSEDSDDFPPTPNPSRRARRSQGKGATSLPTPRPPPPSSLPTLTPDFAAHNLLLKGQYWSTFRPLPLSDSATAELKAGDPNSFAGALMAAEGDDVYADMGKSYWSELEVVREMLGALQGRADAGLFVRSADGGIKVSSTPPSLLHLSPSSFTSLLSTFLPSLQTLTALSSFLGSTLYRTSSSLPRGWGPTVDAFAQAAERCVFDWQARWAAKEVELLHPTEDVVISLLALSEEVVRHLPLLDVLLTAIDSISPSSSHVVSPAASSATLLNTLLLASSHYSSIAEHSLAAQIQRVWLGTAEPGWRALGAWVRKGRLPSMSGTAEFWIKRNEEVELEDGEFFREGFVLLGADQDGNAGRSVPSYLEDFAEEVLECGKAVGLLKALLPGEDWVDGETGRKWPTLSNLVNGENSDAIAEQEDEKLDAASIARKALLPLPTGRIPPSATLSLPTDLSTSFVDALALSTSTLLSPIFHTIHSELHRVVVEECRLLEHVRAIQGVYLMRKGWELGVWCGEVWEKMDRGHLWTDFQLLNSTWARAVAGADWTDSTAFRFRVSSAAGASRAKQASTRSVKMFEKLEVEYNIPWPLIHVFRPETMVLYSTIFTFLLQLRRAKHLVDRLSLIKPSTDLAGLPRPDHELRAYYALRRKLGWLVGVLYEFMMSFIEEEVGRFEKGVKDAASLKEWCERHEKHVEGLRDRLLLNEKASPIHRSIVSILDLCITLSDTWITLNGDTIFNTSRRGSLAPHRRRYNKGRLAHRRRRAAGLSNTDSSEEDESTEDDESDGDNEAGETATFGGGGASGSFLSFADEGFGARIRRIESDLDGHQGFVRRGVDGLARSAGGKEVREVYGLLAVRLSDWM